MSKGVEHRDGEREAVQEAGKESPLPAAALKRAPYVVKQPYTNIVREMLKQRLHQRDDVELLLAGGVHVDDPEDTVVAAKERHHRRVFEEVGAGFFSFFISRLEGRLTPVNDGARQEQPVLVSVFLLVHHLRCFGAFRVLLLLLPHTLNVFLRLAGYGLGDEVGVVVEFRWVPLRFLLLLREARVNTDHEVCARVLVNILVGGKGKKSYTSFG